MFMVLAKLLKMQLKKLNMRSLPKIILSDIGCITETDVTLAKASNAFNCF